MKYRNFIYMIIWILEMFICITIGIIKKEIILIIISGIPFIMLIISLIDTHKVNKDLPRGKNKHGKARKET